MNKFSNDSDNLILQQAAYQAFNEELLAHDQFMDGVISEEELGFFMDATQMAIEQAISNGVSRKDLPSSW